MTLLAMAVLLFTNLGFPYSGQAHSLTPQRYLMAVGFLKDIVTETKVLKYCFAFQNVDKKAFDYSGKLIKEKSGIWIMDMDVNSVHSVEEFSKYGDY